MAIMSMMKQSIGGALLWIFTILLIFPLRRGSAGLEVYIETFNFQFGWFVIWFWLKYGFEGIFETVPFGNSFLYLYSSEIFKQTFCPCGVHIYYINFFLLFLFGPNNRSSCLLNNNNNNNCNGLAQRET